MVTHPYFLTWNKQSGVPVLNVVGAEADEFVMEDQRRLYDFISTSFQASFGHSNALICDRIAQQLKSMPIASPKASFSLKETVSARLLRLLGMSADPESGGRIFYTVSGAEAVENALKVARHFSKRTKVLARRRSYHGATLGAMSVSGDWRSHDHLTFADGTVRIPEPYEDESAEQTREIIEQTGPEQIGAIIVEVISGVNGVVIPSQQWWQSISQLCQTYEILLIADEVLCGFGRTGPPFAFQQFEIQPDMICMSKAMTGGYFPFGAVWISPRIATHYDNSILACGLTNYAHPAGLAALDAVIDLLSDEALLENKRQLGSVFTTHLDKIAGMPGIKDVRNAGLLAAIDLEDDAPPWTRFAEAGNYLFSKDRMIVLAPPFISRPDRLQAAFEDFESVLR